VKITSKVIACIGTRDTTEELEMLMEKIGSYLIRNGFYIISGNAKGSDQAFVRGGNKVDPTKIILCLPWSGFEYNAIEKGNVVQYADVANEECINLAMLAHPVWDNLPKTVKRLMIRNAMIVNKSIFVIANPKPQGKGGTWHAIRIAEMLGIQWRDLNNKDYRRSIEIKINKQGD